MPDRLRPISILLVEDNPGDVRLTIEAFKDNRVDSPFDVARDGVEALAYLRGEGIHAGKPLPDLILLDLNLPRMDGREVLAAIKADPDLMHIPVVVLTTSRAEQDVQKAYLLQAACFITKPVDFDRFIETVKVIDAFWMRTVTLPCGAR
jgi:CheY-like chemotaxis protein